MSYFLAASLVKLRNEVNSIWPNRSKVSDGWIGDAAHSARKSDHNPDWSAPGRRRGVVRALDITTRGIDVDRLLRHTTNDSRVAYVIYNRRIYTHSRGWYRYNGSNPHTNHVHISIAHTNTAENDTKTWISSVSPSKTTTAVTKQKPASKPKPSSSKDPNRYTVRDEASIRRITIRCTSGTEKNSTPHLIGLYQRDQRSPYTLKHDQIWGNATDQHYRWVHALQVELNKWKGTKIYEDGSFGNGTFNRVVEWQKRNMGGAYKGTIADGVVGPLTIKPLGLKAYPN